MQPGIGTYSLPWCFGIGDFVLARLFNAEDLLIFVAGKGIKYVQFGDNYSLHALPGDALTRLKRRADELGIKLQVGTRGLPVSNVKEYLSSTERKRIGR